MLRCCFVLFFVVLIIWAIFFLSFTLFYNPTPQLLPEMCQVSDYSNYTLGDSPLGITWFIQVSDIHIGRTDDVADSFKFDF